MSLLASLACIALTLGSTIPARYPFAADLNGDGADELISLAPVGSGGIVYWNDGNGQYTVAEDLPGPFADAGMSPVVVFGDVDGIPGDELIFIDALGARALKKSNGSWMRIDYVVPDIVVSAGVLDVFGDSRKEVLIVSNDYAPPGTPGTATLRVLDGTTGATLFSREIAPSISYYFNSADLNGDGNDEIIVTGSGVSSLIPHYFFPGDSGFISWFPRNSASLGPEQRILDNHAFMKPVVADLDGDGVADILAGQYFQDLLFLRGRGDGTFASAVSAAAGDNHWGNPYYDTADVDGDGAIEVARISTNPVRLRLLRIAGGRLVTIAEMPLETVDVTPVFIHLTSTTRALAIPTSFGTTQLIGFAECRPRRRAAAH